MAYCIHGGRGSSPRGSVGASQSCAMSLPSSLLPWSNGRIPYCLYGGRRSIRRGRAQPCSNGMIPHFHCGDEDSISSGCSRRRCADGLLISLPLSTNGRTPHGCGNEDSISSGGNWMEEALFFHYLTLTLYGTKSINPAGLKSACRRFRSSSTLWTHSSVWKSS